MASNVKISTLSSYEILNESQLPDISWTSTFRVIVSVDKLTSFVQSKGIAVEIKGGLFALNIKQQLLNEESEKKIICDLIGTVHNVLQQSFDYSLEVKDPQSINGSSQEWEVPIVINVKPNQNMDFVKEYVLSTLNSVSLSKNELENYERLKKNIFEIEIKDGDSLRKFYLRTESSFLNFRIFENLWFYTHSFYIDNGLKTIRNIGGLTDLDEIDLHVAYRKSEITHNSFISSSIYEYSRFPQLKLNFISSKENKNQVVYRYKDKISIEDISKIEKYEIKQDSVRNEYLNGGYRIKNDKIDIIIAPEKIDYEIVKDQNGYLVLPDFKEVIDSVLNSVNEKNYLGYNNWRIINKEETEAFLDNFYSNTFDNNILAGLESTDSKIIITSTEEVDRFKDWDNGIVIDKEKKYLLQINFDQYERDFYRINNEGLLDKFKSHDFNKTSYEFIRVGYNDNSNSSFKTILLVRDFLKK
jgi:hypothetical protein